MRAVIALCVAVSLALAGASTAADANAALDRFERWFQAEGGRWAQSVAPVVHRAQCSGGETYSFRVVSRARVARETVSRAARNNCTRWAVTG